MKLATKAAARASRDDKVLFHCTALTSLPAIRRVGLDPAVSKSSQQAVYLASDLSAAANYCYFSLDPAWHVILAVNLSHLSQDQLGPDDYELRDWLADRHREEGWSDCSWRQSLRRCGQVVCYAPVPPEKLVVVGAFYSGEDFAISKLQGGPIRLTEAVNFGENLLSAKITR